MNKISILLTGAVYQNYRLLAPTGIQDPRERLNDYLCSISSWLKQPEVDHVLYCDASGFEIPSEIYYHPKLEILSLDLCGVAQKYGKGPAESLTLEYAMKNSTRLTENFFKCTGRLFVENFSHIASNIEMNDSPFVLNKDAKRRWADTRFFFLNRKLYTEQIRPNIGKNADYQGFFIEHLYYHFCDDYAEMIPVPRFVGRSGHNGCVYEHDFSQRDKAEAQHWIDRFINPFAIQLSSHPCH